MKQMEIPLYIWSRCNIQRQTEAGQTDWISDHHNIRTEHIGHYSVDIKSKDAKLKTFRVTVHGE